MQAHMRTHMHAYIHTYTHTQGYGSSWYLERVRIEHEHSGQDVEFVTHDWVRGGQMAARSYKPGLRTPGLLSRENSMERSVGGSAPPSPGVGSMARTGMTAAAGGARPPVQGARPPQVRVRVFLV